MAIGHSAFSRPKRPMQQLYRIIFIWDIEGVILVLVGFELWAGLALMQLTSEFFLPTVRPWQIGLCMLASVALKLVGLVRGNKLVVLLALGIGIVVWALICVTLAIALWPRNAQATVGFYVCFLLYSVWCSVRIYSDPIRIAAARRSDAGSGNGGNE